MGGFFNLSRFNLLDGEISVRNTPVTFDGHAITDFVPYANVLDVRIGHPSIVNSSVTPGLDDGEIFGSRRHSVRVIEVDIELPLDKDAYPENVHAVRAWANSKQPKRLIVSAYKSKYIMATCSNINDFSQKEYWKPVTLKFECWDAFFVSIQPTMAQVGSAFTINGDAKPDMEIVYSLGNSGRLTAPQWWFDSDKQIKLNTTVVGGDVLIDLKKQSVYRGNESLMQYVTLASRFPDLEPGQHVITGPSGGTITWYERWL